MKKKSKNIRGITLIALVITMIVLLILAGITIAALNGENGLITKSKLAKFAQEMTSIEENVELKKQNNAMQIIENEKQEEIFNKLLRDSNIEIQDTLKREILYMRDGNPSNKSPNDYNVDDFISDEAIYVIDKETGNKKENTYIYDKKTNVVFKIPPTKIGKKIYHSYKSALLQRGGEDIPQKDLIIKDDFGKVTIDGVTYYEPDLKGFNIKNTQIIYYYLGDDSDNNNYKQEKNRTIEEYLSENQSERYKMQIYDNNYTFYNYKRKCWANIKTVSNGLDAWWVWIPRYAYKIEDDKSISIVYVDINGKKFDGTDLDEGYSVHPSFTVDGQELKGII